MPRVPRVDVGGLSYHVINRANASAQIFTTGGDYDAFLAVLAEAKDRLQMRLCAYCVMPNHWHLVLLPYRDGELSAFMEWLTMTHVRRWHAAHGTVGSGHLYQDRYRSFPIQVDHHFLQVCRYVEQNALRAKLVSRAEDWRWSSAWQRSPKMSQGHFFRYPTLDAWPLPLDRQERYIDWLNTPQNPTELQAIRNSVHRGRPFGHEEWVQKAAAEFGIEMTFRSRGRPRKTE